MCVCVCVCVCVFQHIFILKSGDGEWTGYRRVGGGRGMGECGKKFQLRKIY